MYVGVLVLGSTFFRIINNNSINFTPLKKGRFFMAKYSRLTKEQFEELQEEFINFLATQSITGKEWVILIGLNLV